MATALITWMDPSQHSHKSSCHMKHHSPQCCRSVLYCSVGYSDFFFSCCCFHPWQARNSNWKCIFHLLTSHIKCFLKMKVVTNKSYRMVSPHQTSNHQGLLQQPNNYHVQLLCKAHTNLSQNHTDIFYFSTKFKQKYLFSQNSNLNFVAVVKDLRKKATQGRRGLVGFQLLFVVHH